MVPLDEIDDDGKPIVASEAMTITLRSHCTSASKKKNESTSITVEARPIKMCFPTPPRNSPGHYGRPGRRDNQDDVAFPGRASLSQHPGMEIAELICPTQSER